MNNSIEEQIKILNQIQASYKDTAKIIESMKKAMLPYVNEYEVQRAREKFFAKSIQIKEDVANFLKSQENYEKAISGISKQKVFVKEININIKEKSSKEKEEK